MAIHVLIVDDSAVVRQMMTRIIGTAADLRVSVASDPIIALQKMKGARPDVIVLDLEMPRMDGLTFLRTLMATDPIPVVVCSGRAASGTQTAMTALEEGAVDVIAKPAHGVGEFLAEQRATILGAIRAAAMARVQRSASAPPLPCPAAAPPPRPAPPDSTLIALGASTGGTEALRAVLSTLPADTPGIVVVQHMPAMFTRAFAARLDDVCAISVREAEDGDRVEPGLALIAPGSRHLTVGRSSRGYMVELSDSPPVSRHRPSVDVLFRSVARAARANAVGVLMTGMGADGADGMVHIRHAGGIRLHKTSRHRWCSECRKRRSPAAARSVFFRFRASRRCSVPSVLPRESMVERNLMKRALWTAVLVLSCLPAVAEEKPVTISGYVLTDYYDVASHHDSEIEGKNGFWIRRVYLAFDRTLSDTLSARLRFELNQPGDFKTSATMEPFVKDAYLKWKQSPKLDVILGMSSSPTYDLIEKIWGYRSVEKTPLDLQRIASSRDLGIAFAGAFDDAKKYRFHIQAGNGSGTGSETNEGKKLAVALSAFPTKPLVFEVYGDIEDRPGNTDRMLLQAFAALQKERYRVGVHFDHQERDGANSIDLASAFAVYDVRKDLSILARIDRLFDPNPDGNRIDYLPFDPTSKATLYIAGVDWRMQEHLSIIPNVELVTYDDGGRNDVIPRITFYYTF